MTNTAPIKARILTPIELKMLDVGAPVVVTCETLTGESVAVRLQTANLSSNVANEDEAGAWLAHGAYVAVMPAGDWQ